MSKLHSFTPTTGTNNKQVFLAEDKTDEIIIGSSCLHVFELPFSYTRLVKSAKVIYKQHLDIILEKDVSSDMIIEDQAKNKSMIRVELSPLETQAFEKSLLDAFCQVKIITKDDKILYDTPHKILVISPLKQEIIFGDDE